MAYNPRKKYSKAVRKEAGRFTQADYRALAKVARTKAATLWRKADAADKEAREADLKAYGLETQGKEGSAKALREIAARYWQIKDAYVRAAQEAEADAADLEKAGGVAKAENPAPDF